LQSPEASGSTYSFFMAFIIKGRWSLSIFFLHLLRWSYDFCFWFYLCAVFHLLVCIYRTIPGRKVTWS
jgi:hypothetical protein